ncbi:condensation domain-containing protein [Streptomyces sp. NPDC059534]|uniref:condensation domain-containing protein n=1 Tax=Streptomyces sp. NPDC059534 TaxID=3346859 RepID=UPI003673988A
MAKSARLGRGQRYFWLHHHQLPPGSRHDTHIVLDPPLPEGIAPVRIKAALNYLVRRHEALRTTFPIGADGLPEQRIHPPAALPVRQATVEADGTPSPAEAVRQCTQEDFDLAADWPVRACLVTAAGVPRRLVLVLNHVAFDDWSIDTFLTELAALLAGAVAGRPAQLPAVLTQPAELAAAEGAATGPAHADRTGPWREEIARLPADLFAARREPAAAPPAAGSAALTSPRLLPASRAVAARCRVWPSAVHLAAFAATAAAWTGGRRVPFWLFTSHRDGDASMDVLTCMFAPLLTAVDLADDPAFSEIVRRTADALERAKGLPGTAYDETLELLAEEGARRGAEVRVETELNFLNYAPRSCGTTRTRLVRNPEPEAWARSGSDAYFRIHEWADGVTVALRAAGSVLPADDVERFLRGYEELIVAHADEAVDRPLSEITRVLDFPAPAPAPASAPAPHGAAPATSPGAPEPAVRPAAAAALVAAVGRVNGLDTVDPTAGYVAAGGRLLRAPRVLEVLHDGGWTGLGVRDLGGVRPLAALAGRLTEV